MKNISPDILEKYLAGKCTSEERALVDLWFNQYDGDLEDPRLLNLNERSKLDAKMLHQIKAKIKQKPTDELHFVGPTIVKEKSFPKLYRVAVSIAASLIVGFGVFFFMQQQINPVGTSVSITQVTNTSAIISRHELADGTMIWLRPNSSIEFPKPFSENKRELKLVGEAFFEVAKDADRPFIINTGNVTTQVLGTSFNIKAYDKASSIEVAVLTGKVSVKIAESGNKTEDPSASVLLQPNERVTYVKDKNTLEKEEPKELPELSMWQATNVVFDNVPVKEVIHTLDKKFGVQIIARNKNLLNCLIRADFTNQNLPDILELLSKSVEATYEFQNNKVYLDGEGCVN